MEFPLDHIAIAVPSITAALPTYTAFSAGNSGPIESVPSQHVNVTFVGSGPTRIELIEPTTPESTVQRFLERRGPGLHHIAYRVVDLARTLAELSDAGYRLIDHTPRPGAGGHLVAFLHPSSTGGVLVELVQR